MSIIPEAFWCYENKVLLNCMISISILSNDILSNYICPYFHLPRYCLLTFVQCYTRLCQLDFVILEFDWIPKFPNWPKSKISLDAVLQWAIFPEAKLLLTFDVDVRFVQRIFIPCPPLTNQRY